MDNELAGWPYPKCCVHSGSVLGPKLLSVCIHDIDSGIEIHFKLTDVWLNSMPGRNSY